MCFEIAMSIAEVGVGTVLVSTAIDTTMRYQMRQSELSATGVARPTRGRVQRGKKRGGGGGESEGVYSAWSMSMCIF